MTFSLKRNSECNSRGTPHMTKRRKRHSDLSGDIWQQLGSIDYARTARSLNSRCHPETCLELPLDSELDLVPMQSDPFSILDEIGHSPAFPQTPPTSSDRVLEQTRMDWLSSISAEIDPTLIASLSLHPVTSSADTDTAAGGGLRRRGVSSNRPRSMYNQHIGQLLCAEAAPLSPDGVAVTNCLLA
jgi:hypothetical protein